MTQALLAFAGALIPGLLLAAAITIHGRIQRARQNATWAREQAEHQQHMAWLKAHHDTVMHIWETEGAQAALDYTQNIKLPTSNKM